jgi:transposase
MVEERFGKLILFSDSQDWTNEEILAAYRGQSHIEDAFRQMKDPQFVGWSPMFRWTDPMIRVHAFYCVIALALTSLLWREVCPRTPADHFWPLCPVRLADPDHRIRLRHR